MLSRRTFVTSLTLLAALALAGCADSGNADPKVYHKLEIRLDKSLKEASDIHWSYGPDVPAGYIASARDINNFENHFAPMRIPDEFSISWQTPDGVKHSARAPVKGHLPKSASERVVGILVFYDHIEGYLVERGALGEQEWRFY